MRLVVFGEGMIERRADGTRAYGGDALNTAVYLARQGARPELMTAIGTDPASNDVLAAWADEGIGVEHVLRDPDRTLGRYGICLGLNGERSFTYDRDQSAARHFFSHADAAATLDWAATADIFYLTGITLSIVSPQARLRIGDVAARVRAGGGHVVFDTNYRPAGWPSPKDAWAAMSAFGAHVSLALPSLEDQARLTADADAGAAAACWLGLGAAEVVVKQGDLGAYVADRAGGFVVPAEPAAAVVDTTAAGDAFNAAYVAARLCRHAPAPEAARAAAALAAEVVGWAGAIAPLPVGRIDAA